VRRVISSACPGVIPRGLVVTLRLGVKSGKHPIGISGQLEIVFDDEGRIRVVGQVIFGDAVVLDCVVDDAAKERDV